MTWPKLAAEAAYRQARSEMSAKVQGSGAVRAGLGFGASAPGSSIAHPGALRQPRQQSPQPRQPRQYAAAHKPAQPPPPFSHPCPSSDMLMENDAMPLRSVGEADLVGAGREQNASLRQTNRGSGVGQRREEQRRRRQQRGRGGLVG